MDRVIGREFYNDEREILPNIDEVKDESNRRKRSQVYSAPPLDGGAPSCIIEVPPLQENLQQLRVPYRSKMLLAHPGCQHNINQSCNFGNFSRLVLPPFYVSAENIPLWITRFSADTARKMSGSSDSSHTSSGSSEDRHDVCNSGDVEDSSGVLRIYDGDITNPHGWRNVRVSKDATAPDVLRDALLQFRITEEQNKYYLARAISVNSERRLENYEKPMHFVKNKKPQLFLRHSSLDIKHGTLTIYRGDIPAKQPSVIVEVNLRTPAWRIVERALSLFEIENAKMERYCLVELQMQPNGVDERYVEDEDCVWEDYIGRRKLSIARTHSIRYYLQPVASRARKTSLFIGNLPYNLTNAQYEASVTEIMGEFVPDCIIEYSFPLYGAIVIEFPSIDSLISGYFRLKDASINERRIYVKIIPIIEEKLLPNSSWPLLVFVNGKSGGGQGAKLINFFQRTLNPYQIFDLMEGGPLPGLYTFRKVQNFRILICGGDGTFGWVLSSIDEANKYMLLTCKEPPCALLPLGTGNDLARVLNWGSGYTSSDDLTSLLLSVDDAVETNLDRWSVVFDVPASPDSSSSEDEQANVIIMNNYFGIGVDAMLSLDFHLAREEQPDKFNSRLRNKGVYFKSGLKNIAKSSNSNLQDKIELEVDGKTVNIPSIEGLLILNIPSWAGGSDPWGKDKDTKFKQPSLNDGLVELMGFTGVVHMVNLKVKAVIPMQIDGEPWMQQPCDIVIRPTVQQAKMLAKNTPLRKRLSSKTLGQKSVSTQE
eukprot:gene8071-13987_t